MKKKTRKKSKRTFRFNVVEAEAQHEFPGWQVLGTPVTGKMYLIELYREHDASSVLGWFCNPDLAEEVVRLLNANSVEVR